MQSLDMHKWTTAIHSILGCLEEHLEVTTGPEYSDTSSDGSAAIYPSVIITVSWAALLSNGFKVQFKIVIIIYKVLQGIGLVTWQTISNHFPPALPVRLRGLVLSELNNFIYQWWGNLSSLFWWSSSGIESPGRSISSHPIAVPEVSEVFGPRSGVRVCLSLDR